MKTGEIKKQNKKLSDSFGESVLDPGTGYFALSVLQELGYLRG